VRIKLSVTSLFAIAVSFFFAGCAAAPPANQSANGNVRTGATPPSNTSSAPAATPDEFASARATFAQVCSRCHKPDASGGIFELDDGTKLKVPSLREGHALKDSDEEFIEQIEKGGDGMPAFKNKLEPEQIRALVRFIRHEFQGKHAGSAAP
jgi:mono/diheme cytochrome c family protein